MAHEYAYESTTAASGPAAVDPRREPIAAELVRPSGPAAAVVLAAGLGSFTLGLLSVLTAASSSVSSALTFSDRVGDLSGVTTITVLVYAGAWAVLALRWRRANLRLMRVATVTAILIALGLLGTFPPFFNAI
jgi:hypothetical protein